MYNLPPMQDRHGARLLRQRWQRRQHRDSRMGTQTFLAYGWEVEVLRNEV